MPSHALIPIWKSSLTQLLAFYETRRDRLRAFYPGLFLFFIARINALLNPFDNLRNIYFGLIMGVSASLPTCLHIGMFIRSGIHLITRREIDIQDAASRSVPGHRYTDALYFYFGMAEYGECRCIEESTMNTYPFDTNRLIDICRQNDVSKVGIFGSMVRGEETKSSDIDLLVEFNSRKSLLALVRLQRELSEALEREVDVQTEAALSPYLRDRIIQDLQVIYES